MKDDDDNVYSNPCQENISGEELNKKYQNTYV